MEFLTHSHSTGNNVHHIEWCTKYRYRMFSNSEKARIAEEAIRNAAQRHCIAIRELAVMPEHIHVIAELPPDMSQSYAVQILKGASSREIFKRVPHFRLRYPNGHLWSCGNFKDSVGRVTLETAENYVRRQGLWLYTGNCGL